MSAASSIPAIVVDTDVLSFLFNGDPTRGPRYMHLLQGHRLVVPFAVVGELLYGAAERGWGPSRRGRLEQFIARNPVEYPSYELCEIWAELRARARHLGRPVERQDAWVAATALYLNLPLATHNARHYLGIPKLQVITSPDISS
jgi:predicted nucleic acid-binding protein